MSIQDFGMYTRCDHQGIFAVGPEDKGERMVGAWYANSTVPHVSTIENVETGLVLHFAASAGKIFVRFES